MKKTDTRCKNRRHNSYNTVRKHSVNGKWWLHIYYGLIKLVDNNVTTN